MQTAATQNYSTGVTTNATTLFTSATTIAYMQATEYLARNITLRPRPLLQGLTITGPEEMAVNTTPSFKAQVTDGVGVRFEFNISYYNHSSDRWLPVPVTVNHNSIHSANVTFSPVYDGNYSIQVSALSRCDEILKQDTPFKASLPIHPSDAVPTTKAYDGGYYYPHDLVGIALKVVNYTDNYSNYMPTVPSCTVDWGDEKGKVTANNVDLTPDPATHFTYSVNYSYSQTGTFMASVICQNNVSLVKSFVIFQVVSPVNDTSAELLINPVPYPVSGAANGSIRIVQNILSRNYPDLHITVNFGVSNSTTALTYLVDSKIIPYIYYNRGNYLVSVTFESFNLTSTYVMKIRIGALVDFYHVKRRSMIRIKEPTKFKVVRYLWNYTLNVTLDMSPGTQKISLANDTEAVYINMTYADVDFKRATARIVMYGVIEEMYYDFETYVPCISTIDLFESTYREEETPLEAWLSTLPKISGRAERTSACNESDKFNMTWQVWIKNDLSPNNKWVAESITQPNAIVMDFTFIKSPGLYKLELNISVIGKREKESDTMFLKVDRAPLVAKISEGAFRQVKIGTNLQLKADIESRDPPFLPAYSSLKFFWSCYKLFRKEDITRYALPYYHNDTSYRQGKNRCSIAPLPETGNIIIHLNATSFKSKDLILFEVNVTKDSRSEIATQVIEILNAELGYLFIDCVWNCERKLSTDDRTVLKADISCASCGSKDIYEAQFRWSVFKYNPQTFSLQEIPEYYWDTKITSNRNSSRFDTEGVWWEDATTYTIMVAVNISKCVETVAMKVVFTNIKPYQGNCSVHPTNGTATETIFSFRFLGWKDEGIRIKNSLSDTNFGLQYAVFQLTSSGSHLIYFGSEIQASTMLSECSTSAENCEVVVYIIDIFRARVDCSLQVMIYPKYQQTTSNSNSTDNVNDILLDMDKKMNSSKSVKDYIKIAKRAATLSSSLSSLNKAVNDGPGEATTTTTTTMSSLVLKQVDKAVFFETANNFVDIVGDVIQNFNSSSPEEVQILANSMSVLTKDKELMTRNSVDKASKAISKLATTFQNMDANLPDLNPCLEEITDAINNIIKYQAIDMDTFYSDITNRANKQGLSKLETENIIDYETKKMRLQLYNQFYQIQSIVNNLTLSWDVILKFFPKMEDPSGMFNKSKQSYSMTTQKATLADVKNSSNYISPSEFTFKDVDVGDDELSPMIVKIVKSKNIYVHGANSRFINHDIIIGSAEDKDGKKLNISNPEVIHKTLESNCTDHENLPIITPSFIEGDAAGMFYHQFEYPKPLTPDMFEPCKEKCFPPNTFKKSGTVYVGLKPSYISYNLEDPYTFGVTTSACFSWNETIKDWVTNQCRLEKENGNVICRCQGGYQLISAVSFNFQPNSIHFGTVFSKFDIKAQGIVFGVLLSLYLIFAILCFWAHYMDKKGIFQGFPTGSVCHFVYLACPKCLGESSVFENISKTILVKEMRHPWFLDRIEIVDIQTRKAVNSFISVLKQMSGMMNDAYQSRVERTACCLAFLLRLAMITSAMFYTGVPDANRKQPKVDFEIGPIRIGYQQLYYSFLSAVITALPMLIIVTLFRKARTKRDPSTEISKTRDELNKTKIDKKQFQCTLPWMVKLEQQLKILNKILLVKPSSEEFKKTWPQAFRYIAWIIIAIAVVASSFFVILYNRVGKDITEQWLTTFFLAFLQSLFVLDPFKVIVISVCLAILVKKVKLKGLDELDLSLIVQVNEEYGLKQRQDHSEMQALQSAPLSKLALQTATLRRKIHIMIKNTLQEFLIHCVYLLIVSSLCCSNRSTNAFRIYKVINDQLVSDTSTGFLKINSSEQYYDWISNILTPWLLPDLSKGKRNNSNLDKIFNTEVQDIYLMGAARIRQLRIQKENCILYGAVLKDCVPSYRSGLEDTNNYCLGWGPRPCSKFEELNSVSSAAWLYKSAQDVWGLPIAGTYSIYGGGGYIVYLNINSKVANTILKELKEKLWIDQKMRSCFS
ncbi:hypothetical protein Btru_044492 [Bulinus truncatus]|nr:hypothetical protein Btru_044492 [Bulinus truncatus]